MKANILVISGDGIGPEVTVEAVKVLKAVEQKFNHKFAFDEALLGGVAIDKTGNPFPKETLEKAKKADAILLGAVGGPKWEGLDYSIRPERGLLGIRSELGLFANLRPAKVFDSLVDSSTLKPEVVQGLDILIVRELTGGIYFGKPRGVTTLPDGQKQGINTEVYTTNEIKRIAEVAFEAAKIRGKKVCSIDKANVLEVTELWRQVVADIHKEKYQEIELSNMYVDNAAMQLIRNPKQFDVMLTNNIFGDILSDAASMLTGSIGMLPSASLGGVNPQTNRRFALYEPIHGSAPDIAGKGVANPLATIASVEMMLRTSFGLEKEADAVQDAIQKTLKQGIVTADISKKGAKIYSTVEVGEAVVQFLK
jgi:3-isopropylmalate dehydrogenase